MLTKQKSTARRRQMPDRKQTGSRHQSKQAANTSSPAKALGSIRKRTDAAPQLALYS